MPTLRHVSRFLLIACSIAGVVAGVLAWRHTGLAGLSLAIAAWWIAMMALTVSLYVYARWRDRRLQMARPCESAHEAALHSYRAGV